MTKLTSESSLADLQREYSRIGELIRYKVCGDPSVTISAYKEQERYVFTGTAFERAGRDER